MKLKLAALLFILPALAGAQTKTQAPWKYAHVPLCVAPQATPVDGFRLYCDSPTWPGLPPREFKPYAFPNGGVRYGLWQGCPADSVVSFTLLRGALESKRSGFFANHAPPLSGKCWLDATVSAPPLVFGTLKTPSDWLTTLGSDCLKDPACGQLVFDTCMRDASCKALIATKLTAVDYDQDGTPGTPSDAYWLGEAIAGRVR